LELASHSHEELVAGLVGVAAAGDAWLQIKQVELAANLERQLLAGLDESQGSALITA
jgi:hypothetical protein